MLALGIALSLPYIQTKIAIHFTNSINKDYGTNIAIEGVRVSVFGGVKFKNVLILDHHKDTLIYSEIVNTNILEGKKILDGDLIFGNIRLEGLLFNLKTYKGEKETNIDRFINAFNTNKPSGKHFLLKANRAYISNGHFTLTDENKEIPKSVDFTRLNASISNFLLYGPAVKTTINRMSFQDHHGLYVVNLSSKFSYTKKSIKLEALDLSTKESKFKGDVFLNYKIEDFSSFTDKVKIDIQINSSKLASNDIRHFYDELGKNQFFTVKASIKGTLNDLNVTKLRLVDSNKSQIIGDVNFKNIFGTDEQRFFMNGNFQKISSSYEKLVRLLPNVLGKKLPKELKKLGNFTLIGNSQLSATALDADFSLDT